MKKVTRLRKPAHELCPIRDMFDEVGDKWSIIVFIKLREGAMRFSELRRAIPDISQRMLTLTLRKLERDGYATRKVTPLIPPRVDYELTGFGQDFLVHLLPIARWFQEHRDDVARAREAFDRAA
jgi:DNA-binding HxlR family transcriptional regulator